MKREYESHLVLGLCSATFHRFNSTLRWRQHSRVIQTFGFAFLFLGWTSRGRAVLWCLLLGLLLRSVFIIVVVVVVVCARIYKDRNILTSGQFASSRSVGVKVRDIPFFFFGTLLTFFFGSFSFPFSASSFSVFFFLTFFPSVRKGWWDHVIGSEFF